MSREKIGQNGDRCRLEQQKTSPAGDAGLVRLSKKYWTELVGKQYHLVYGALPRCHSEPQGEESARCRHGTIVAAGYTVKNLIARGSFAVAQDDASGELPKEICISAFPESFNQTLLKLFQQATAVYESRVRLSRKSIRIRRNDYLLVAAVFDRHRICINSQII